MYATRSVGMNYIPLVLVVFAAAVVVLSLVGDITSGKIIADGRNKPNTVEEIDFSAPVEGLSTDEERELQKALEWARDTFDNSNLKMSTVQAPPFSTTRPRISPHVGTNHGADTDQAYNSIETCAANLKVFDCPASGNNPMTFLYICPVDQTHTMCAGVFVGHTATRLTGWIMPCAAWYDSAKLCAITIIGGD